MLKLCWKDFFIIRRFLLPAPFFFVILMNMFVFSSPLFLLASVLLSFLMIIAVPLIEEKYRTELTCLSLPVKKQTIVIARYISAFFIAVIGLGLSFVSSYFYSFIFTEYTAAIRSLISLRGGILFIFFTLILAAVFFPFYYRFSIEKALLFFPVVVTGFFAVIWLGYNLVSLFLNRSGPLFTAQSVILFWEDIQNSVVLPLSQWLMILLLSALVSISAFISIKAYQQKDL